MQFPSKLPITGLSQGRAFKRGGFTLVEMLVSIAVLALIMTFILSITDQTSKVWKNSTSEIQAFQSARAAYDTMTLRLSQATLNTYLDYYDSGFNARTPATAASFTPTYYARNSDLHFVVDKTTNLVPLDTSSTPAATAACYPGHAVFFQAPLGMTVSSSTSSPNMAGLPNMLNACGYYVEFNTDLSTVPPFLTSVTAVQQRYRYRLMEFLQPTENNSIYGNPYVWGQAASVYDQWFTNFLPPNLARTSAPIRMLAENIICLVLQPELSPQSGGTAIAPNFTYDSRLVPTGGTLATVTSHHQLPPLVRVVMVAIDEPSALHLNPDGVTTPPSFITTFFSTGSPLPFTVAANVTTDLNNLTTALSAHKVNYRIFDTDVAIRGAKWSAQ